jgi:hypothetical protein
MIEALHIGGGELTVRTTTGDWHEILVSTRNQLLRFG